MSRIRLSLDRDWCFRKGDIPGAEQVGAADADWEAVEIPHDWSIEGPFANDPPSKEGEPPTRGRLYGFLPIGVGWYRKKLALDPRLRDRRLFLEFEGVFRNSVVWVNGKEAGRHLDGYTGFILDVTGKLRADGENVIAVRADATEHEGWWYEGCGIYRHVWLIATDELRVGDWGVFIATPEVSAARARVAARVTLRNDGQSRRSCILRVSVISAGGRHLAKAQSALTLDPGGQRDCLLELTLKNPRLWSPETPCLYMALTQVLADNRVVDEVSVPFGIREFEFTADRGFFLNGRNVQLRGMCIHHDFGGLGAALPDRAHEKTVEAMKSAGCNFLRCSHNDAAPALLDACDRLGLLVWGETRQLGEADYAFPPLRSLIRRARNHPSVICWGLANTAGGKDQVRTNYLRELNRIAHEEDPTRPTAVALEDNTDANANGFALITDLVGYNGGGLKNAKYLGDHARYPERKMLFSEYSSGRGARGVYAERAHAEKTMELYEDGRLLKHAGQYCSVYDLCLSHEEEWSRVARNPWLAGGAMWSGIEYRGESPGWPMATSEFGIFDTCRFPKDAFYYYLQEWTEAPMVHVFPHWNWEGRAGEVIDVWGYSNCETVELFLNGRSLGARARQPLTHMEWKVPYEPGALLAIGHNGRREVCRHEVATAGAPARLHIAADKRRIRADGTDLAFLEISILDHNGRFVPTANNMIKVVVEGAGRLIGLDSGDPGCHVPPKKTERMAAFNGLLLAVVQNSWDRLRGKRGMIRVAASADGLEEASIRLAAQGTAPKAAAFSKKRRAGAESLL